MTNLEFVRAEMTQLIIDAAREGSNDRARVLSELLSAVEDALIGASRVRDVVRTEAGLHEELRRPRSRSSMQRIQVAASASAPLRRGRVLIVDDELLVAAAVQRVLRKDHDVVAMTSARHALVHIVAGERWDAIVCDLMMPDMTGMDFFQALHKVVPGQAKRTLFLSGGAVTPRAQTFAREHAHRCAEKPLDVIELRDRVAELIGLPS